MLLLNRLLDALFDKGHKVLIFSQFTTMLDVIVCLDTFFRDIADEIGGLGDII
jgi:ATP-dependent DNA helicase